MSNGGRFEGMQIRNAAPEELDGIYRMGFDAWGEGSPLDTYLESCRKSRKYREGTWYVLVDGKGTICSSLIRYVLSQDTCGIGSLATPRERRRQGYASRLLTLALARFETEGYGNALLFSDIDPEFYRRHGFVGLPPQHQHSPGSLCMIRGSGIQARAGLADFKPPAYF
jgi:predicted N-acetyltransferase YhbS